MAFQIKEYVDSAMSEMNAPAADGYGSEKACLLMGLASLATVTGEEDYRTLLYKALEGVGQDSYAAIGACFAYEATREDKYKEMIQKRMEVLQENLDSLEDELGLVFYMKYETRLGGRERYQDVVNRFQSACAKENKDDAYCMFALIEALDSVDQAIYEHYDTLKRLYKECLANVLGTEELDSTQMALSAYAILKGCRMRVVLAEKYEDTGMELAGAALEAADSEDMNKGACILAYAESVLH